MKSICSKIYGALSAVLLVQPVLVHAQVDGAAGAQDTASSDGIRSEDPDDRDRSTSATNSADGFSAEFGLELRYDDNVVLEDIDLNTGLGDEALLFTARGEYEGRLDDKTTYALGYRFSQLSYEEFSNLDLQTHTVSAELEHDFGEVDGNLSYRFIHARLGEDGFVDIHRVSPSISGFASRKVLLRAAYIYSDKDFLGRDDRDAEVHAVDTDVYWLIDGPRTFFAFGYRLEDETASEAQFSYQSSEFSARFSQRFKIAGRRAQFRLGARYEDRNYRDETPSIGAVRNDDRYRLSAEIEWRATSRIELVAGYEFSDFQSNLPSADFKQSVFSFGAKLEL